MGAGTARSRRRSTDVEAIKELALEQLASGGPSALSLNAIARRLGLTGPALYRYVSGRDELIRLLLLEAFDGFAAALHDARRAAPTPEEGLRRSAEAYRAWAGQNPMRYQLMMGDALRGFDAGAAVAERAMAAFSVLVDLVADLRPGSPSEHARAAARGWIRLHGFVSLEISGHLELVEGSPDDLFRSEVDGFLRDLLLEDDAMDE